jgi:hypothetical protein
MPLRRLIEVLRKAAKSGTEAAPVERRASAEDWEALTVALSALRHDAAAARRSDGQTPPLPPRVAPGEGGSDP